MELIVFLAIIFFIFIYVMIRGSIDERKRREKYRQELKANYGKFQTYIHTADEFKRIVKLYERNKEKSNTVDDITWNDLNMDGIFEMMDFAQSSSGEEYLYAMLRQPKLSDDDKYFEKLDRHIDYMMKNEDKRLDTMMLLSELGKKGRYSLYDYMEFLGNAGSRSNFSHYLCIAFIVLAVLSIFVNVMVGVILVICAAGVNITTYLKYKSSSAPYVSTFSYIIRLMECRNRLLAVDYGNDMAEYVGRLRENQNKFKGFDKNSNMVLNMNESVGSLGGVFFEYVKMLTHIDIIKFNKMLDMVQKNEQEIFELTLLVGYIDAVISIAYFRAALPYYCVPILTNDEGETFSIKEGFHPAIKNPVSNSFEQKRGMLITGSNASGKSTFLKMTAINAILAQTVHTCAAKAYKGNYYRIYSSMALRDNLDNGESYYIVEIKALKRILDEVYRSDDKPVLCFVDEVLRGTNTVERIAASTQILEKLSTSGVICFAATHDIELTHLLEDKYDNYHFREEVSGGDIIFPYQLLQGRAQTRNAIKLLEIIGFSEDVINNADEMARNFLDKGEWNNVC
jgi:hypothetical protein